MRDERVKNFNLNEKQLDVLIEKSHAILHDLIFRNGLKFTVGNNMSMRKRCMGLYADFEKLIHMIYTELEID